MATNTDASRAPLRILTFSTLYPNAVQIRHGIFVEQRLRKLVATGQVDAKVVAPVPWFPSTHPRFGEYAVYPKAPAAEQRHGIEVLHPRYPVLPKIGMHLAPWLLAGALYQPLRRLLKRHPFELIDAHYFYPDGVAAALLAKRLNKPLIITARGSDAFVIGDYALPRRMILAAARQAGGIITVAAALKRRLIELGANADNITVLRNGVDLNLFSPADDRAACRAALGISPQHPTLVSVGLLVPRKGHDLSITALTELPEYRLILVGDGPQRDILQALATRLGVADRVRFVATVTQPELRNYYAAADASLLTSSTEGMPNVVLESLACGTPAAATRAGGTDEVVGPAESGILIEQRSATGIASAVRKLFAALPDRATTRRYAETFSWDATTAGQLQLFQRVLSEAKG